MRRNLVLFLYYPNNKPPSKEKLKWIFKRKDSLINEFIKKMKTKFQTWVKLTINIIEPRLLFNKANINNNHF